MSQPTPEALNELIQLLSNSFELLEFRLFWTSTFGPNATATFRTDVFAEMIHEAVGQLARHQTADADFFRKLAKARPRRANEVFSVAARWGVVLDRLTPPSGAQELPPLMETFHKAPSRWKLVTFVSLFAVLLAGVGIVVGVLNSSSSPSIPGPSETDQALIGKDGPPSFDHAECVQALLRPDCGTLYRTTMDLPKQPEIRKDMLILVRPGRSIGRLSIRLPIVNRRNQWRFENEGDGIEILLDSNARQEWNNSLIELPSEGFYRLTREYKLETLRWPQNSIVQLGYLRDGKPILFLAQRHAHQVDNELHFLVKGSTIEVEALKADPPLLDPLGFYLDTER